MDLNLNLPDDLAERVRPYEDQLVRILELGLRSLELEDEDSETEASELPEAWRAAFDELMRHRAADAPLPRPEELVAYYHGALEPAEEEKLLGRLALHPEAARDLLDLIWFDSPEASRAGSRSDTARALRRFRAGLDELPETKASVHPFPAPPAGATPPRSRLLRYRALGWAAVLLLAVGALWIPRWIGPSPDRSGYAAVIEVTASRGARPFPVSGDVGEILLILPHVESIGAEGSERATVRILAADDEVIYQDALRGSSDPWSRLYLRLPRDRFSPGTYLVEISSLSTDTRPDTREYRFAIEDPTAP